MIAVISDVHGNLPALTAVFEDIDCHGITDVWCLGDTVGYGAHPGQCLGMVQERCSIVLAGNHDYGACGTESLRAFNSTAALALGWTRDTLTEQERLQLAELGASKLTERFALHHGSPRDPVWEYVISTGKALASIRASRRRVTLVGHSHAQLIFCETADGRRAEPGETVDISEGRWLLNPGSVGQPRDGDPRAAWMAVTEDATSATFHRVDYDIAAAQHAISQHTELRPRLADRLATGE